MSVCGELARWVRSVDRHDVARFVCDAHRVRGDQAIRSNEAYQRVTLRCDVLFAGVSMLPWIANAEALNQLEAAIRSRGGLINFHSAACETRHTSPPPPPGEASPEGEKG